MSGKGFVIRYGLYANDVCINSVSVGAGRVFMCLYSLILSVKKRANYLEMCEKRINTHTHTHTHTHSLSRVLYELFLNSQSVIRLFFTLRFMSVCEGHRCIVVIHRLFEKKLIVEVVDMKKWTPFSLYRCNYCNVK